MEKTKMKSYSLSEMIDKHVGKRGTKARGAFEHKLNMAVLSSMIRKARKERNLTQEQLGELVGVQKAQISKLENNANSATIDTILRIFQALQAEIHFSVTLGGKQLSLA
ncbi:helix-turn-helix protein [Sediminibacterium magnilacihabitans]|jgi:HTH-type transcriptional regulator/antitoxin HipB|nr:helix-turn-helix protein [Sediminibacterium magnilacihabitans]